MGFFFTLVLLDSIDLESLHRKHPHWKNWSELDSSHNSCTAGGLFPSHLIVKVRVCPPEVAQLLEAQELRLSQLHEVNEEIPVLQCPLFHCKPVFVCWCLTLA